MLDYRVIGTHAITVVALETVAAGQAAPCLEQGKRFLFNYDYCKGCGICFAECPCGAIKMVAEDI